MGRGETGCFGADLYTGMRYRLSGSGTEGGTLGVLNCDSCFATVTTFAVRSFQHQYGLHMTFHLLFWIISHFPAICSILGSKDTISVVVSAYRCCCTESQGCRPFLLPI